jgi:hypothetical protein
MEDLRFREVDINQQLLVVHLLDLAQQFGDHGQRLSELANFEQPTCEE